MGLWQKYTDTFKAAWNEEKNHKEDKRSSIELEFLPAVLEIQEMPPHPLAHIIIRTIILFFVIALLWGYFGKIDIVAVAQGKIIASGQDRIVQPGQTH